MNNLTEIIFILDRSGSMSGLESDTIGGFNAMMAKQRKEPGQALVSTILFDDRSEVLHDRVRLEEVKPMTEREYFVRGSTALLDAIGGAIHHMANVHKYARPEDRPGKTVVVITTDGYENASCRYSAEEVKAMVAKEQEKYGWEFLFLGANMDAVSAAESCGIRRERAVQYTCDAEGVALNFEAVSMALNEIRSCRPLAADWKAEIEKDHKRRGTPRKDS